MSKRRPKGEQVPQTKISQFFDTDLLPRIKAGAKALDMSMSGFVQKLVVRGLAEADRKKRSRQVEKAA